MDRRILKELSIEDENTKIQDLLIDEILSLKDKISFERYSILVQNYLLSRISNKVMCADGEIKKLRELYSDFSKDERASLKFMQKLYNYIDDLIYISKNDKVKKSIKNNINEMSIKKLISLKNQMSKDKYISHIIKYLYQRISKKRYCNDREINELEKLSNIINYDSDISDDKKRKVNEYVIKLIVYSKNSDKKNYLKRLSKINLLSKNELYMYLETIIKYAYFALDDSRLEMIILLFKNNFKYLEKIEKLLKENGLISNCYYLIDELKKKIIDEYNNSVFIFPKQELIFKEEKNVITIDEAHSPDLDGAFSVEKKGDIYVLEVYITDVPSFLLENEAILKEAYKKSTSIYNNQNSNNLLIIDMLPKEISHNLLSLKKNEMRDVITFTYYIDKSGNISLENISKNSVFINENISPKTADNIIKCNSNFNRTHRDLQLYREVCEMIKGSREERFIKEINLDIISNIVGIPSIITNYHIGKNSDFAIYREKGIYTKESKDKYTHSSTPLRKFVSNINLVFYLNQIGVINCPDKYLHYVEDRLDEIIEHINDRELQKESLQKNYKLMKKYCN